MDFIGIKSELATLNKEYSRNSGFVVIYGRRRVGKTTLIKEFIKDKNALYFLATEEVEAGCMSRFARELAKFQIKSIYKMLNLQTGMIFLKL